MCEGRLLSVSRIFLSNVSVTRWAGKPLIYSPETAGECYKISLANYFILVKEYFFKSWLYDNWKPEQVFNALIITGSYPGIFSRTFQTKVTSKVTFKPLMKLNKTLNYKL